MAEKRTIWTPSVHTDLVKAVMTNVPITQVEWETKVAPELRAKGHTFNYSAAMYARRSLKTKLLPPSHLPPPTSHFAHNHPTS